MKPRYDCKPRFPLIVLASIALIGFTIGSVIATPPQDTRRKIVSHDFTKNRREAFPQGPRDKSKTATSRPKPRTYRLASPAIKPKQSAANAIAKLGITIWRLRPGDIKDAGRRALLREKGKTSGWVAERVEADAIFREGDYVRISVESPRTGYLYVVDRDLFADGTTGRAMLIYPWPGVDNKLHPGRLIDIPGQEDVPSYFSARLTGANQVGELLTFIVTSTPLALAISDEPSEIASGQVKDWERRWGGANERFELEGGAGEAWTLEEQQAAAKDGTRQLTRDDPLPQTIYRVSTPNTKGLLLNVRLRYGK
ncbi:MAG TPA: hypothetical protein VJU86_16415 [Pyrinomonadaceae bacterium]|nr:hypothetical protein [Pyrinomonadaceae bacterium]